jgi:hypothetical protein
MGFGVFFLRSANKTNIYALCRITTRDPGCLPLQDAPGTDRPPESAGVSLVANLSAVGMS